MLTMKGVFNAIKSIKQRIWRWRRIIRSRLGSNSKLDSPDRHFQEAILIPTALNDGDSSKILYIGVSWYTYHYYKTLFKTVDLITIDISSEQAIYGSKKHVIGDLSTPELTTHGPFNIIFMLGVLNYGINNVDTLHETLRNLNKHLTADGCCYLTVEEPRSESSSGELDAATVTRIFEGMSYHIQPISEWLAIIGAKAATRFFVASRSRGCLEAVTSRFANRCASESISRPARAGQ